MIWWLALLSHAAFPVDDFSSLKRLEEKLPTYQQLKLAPEEINIKKNVNRFSPPTKTNSLEEILQSGTEVGALKARSSLYSLSGKEQILSADMIFIRYHKLEDQLGFKYVIDKDGKTRWRVKSHLVEPLQEDLVMHEKPAYYTPAPANLTRTQFDKNWDFTTFFSFKTGLTAADYMRDLFEDKSARYGSTIQLSLGSLAKLKLPFQLGLGLHYERTNYSLSNGAQLIYSAPSLGPRFSSLPFKLFNQELKINSEVRLGPLTKLTNTQNSEEFKFYSTDWMISIEAPFKNYFGDFSWGIFYQTQWLNLRDQKYIVNIRASSQTNKALGMCFTQAFQ